MMGFDFDYGHESLAESALGRGERKAITTL